jgi:uncharacterized protein with PIN domain
VVAVDVGADPTATLGHAVQSVGVPMPEVGALRADGVRLDPRRPVAGLGDVDVLARERPQPLDGPPRLLLDVHLGALARRLRLLGVDVAYRNDAADDELAAQSVAEDRLLLTQDRGLLMRRALRRAAYVRGARPDDQLADVLSRFALPLAPFTRCTVCNRVLEPVAAADVVDLLEPGTRRTQREFSRCPGCGRVYWPGAHAARLTALVRRSVGEDAAPQDTLE